VLFDNDSDIENEGGQKDLREYQANIIKDPAGERKLPTMI